MKKIIPTSLFLFLCLGVWAQQVEKEITLKKRIVDKDGFDDFTEIRLTGEAAAQFQWQEHNTFESVVIRTEEVLQVVEGQAALGKSEAVSFLKYVSKIVTIDEKGIKKEYTTDNDYEPQEEWEMDQRWFRRLGDENEDIFSILYLNIGEHKTAGGYQLIWGEDASDCPNEFGEEEMRSVGNLTIKLKDKDSKTLSLRTVSTKKISKSEDEVMRLVEIRTETYIAPKE